MTFVLKIPADGNCLFGALAFAIVFADGPRRHDGLLMDSAAQHMRRVVTSYYFVPGMAPFLKAAAEEAGHTVEEYVKRMTPPNRAWGGHLEIMIASALFRHPVQVWQGGRCICFMDGFTMLDARSADQTTPGIARIVYSGSHYDALLTNAP